MPQHLVRLAAHAKDPLPSDNASSRGPFAAPDATAAPEPGDDVERSWLRRLADVLDAPGEIDADAPHQTVSCPSAAKRRLMKRAGSAALSRATTLNGCRV